MVKRLVCTFLVVCVMLAPMTALSNDFTMGYPVGDTTYKLEGKYCVEAANAVVSGNNINFSPGGSVKYDFLLPFNIRSVTVSYEGNSSAALLINTGSSQYSVKLMRAKGKELLNFGEHLGYAPMEYSYTGRTTEKEFVERAGERLFTVSASGAVRITGIEFEKERVPVPTNPFALPDLSANERAIEAAVILDRDASMIMVNGGRRYINIDDPQETPLVFDGRIYLPIEILARALGYYYESIPEKNYALLRKEPYEFVFLNGKCTLQRNAAEPEEIENLLHYRDDRAFLPVRYFAEALGKTVVYKDGIAAIDNKFSAADILNNYSVFNYVKNRFSDFHPQKAVGNTYYVAQTPNADDSNNGSIFAPFRTLAKAGETAKAGDTVMIRAGTYREVLTPQNDGTAVNPIVFKAAEGEKVVISANEEVGGFIPYKDNIYTARIAWDLGDGRNQIFIGEKSLTEARYPNGPSLYTDANGPQLSNMWPVRGGLSVELEGDSKTVIGEGLLNQPANHWAGGYYVGLFGYGWAMTTARIASSQPGSLRVEPDIEYWWWNTENSNHLNFGYITGHLNCLDEPGEWIIDDGTLYIIFPEGFTPQNVTVEAKRRQLVADIADRRYVKIEGISTIGGGVRMNNSEMCVLDGLDMHYISHYIDGGDQREGFIDRPRNNTDQNGAPPRGEMGIYVGGTDNIIVNNIIDHSAASGIYATGLYTYIENNALNDCGYMGSYVSGINLFTEAWNSPNHPRGGYAIFNNTVYNCGRSTFNVSRSQQAGYGLVPFIPYEVAFNDFHDGILTSLDTGLTYEYYTLQGHDKLKSSMHHNLVYYTVAPEEKNAFCMGIYHDGGTQGIDTYNNVVFTTQQDTVFTYGEVFVQPLPVSVAYNQVWNNSKPGVIEGGVAALKEEHYPNGQPFYAGARLEGEKYLVNYERVTENKNNGSFLWAKDAELSDGIVIDEYGYAAFSGDGQYIRFKDVDFGEASNVMSLVFAGDMYNTCDKVEIIIGDFDSGKRYTNLLNVTSPYIHQNNTLEAAIAVTAGISDVYIRVADYRSLKIVGLTLKSRNIDNSMAAKVYGGTFDSYTRTLTDQYVPARHFGLAGDVINPTVNNTWPGTVLEYKQIMLSEDSDTLEVAIASGGIYAGQPVEIRIGAPDGKLIAKYYVNSHSFTDYTPNKITLDEILEAGMYDFYLVFPLEPRIGNNKSSNVYYFGFKKIN